MRFHPCTIKKIKLKIFIRIPTSILLVRVPQTHHKSSISIYVCHNISLKVSNMHVIKIYSTKLNHYNANLLSKLLPYHIPFQSAQSLSQTLQRMSAVRS